MVGCLERTDGNAEFHQIVDFLTTSSIHYALTVSPTIYASYIEQFWATAKSKTVNDVKQIHAIVDGKKVVISESSVRSDLHFNDEDGITCLLNDEIFVNLALMGYERVSTKLTFQKAFFSPQWQYLIHTILHCLSSKTTAWNKFSTNLASSVICLAKGQQFNFYKLIFDGMLRNLDPTSKKFLMYPRFLQLFLNNQIALAEPFNDVYVTPVHSKKVFTNMKRQNKDFSGRITPLFASMLAPSVVEGEDEAVFKEKLVQVTEPGVNTPGSDEERIKHQKLTDYIPPTPHDLPLSRGYTPVSDEGRPNINELMAICTNLSNMVLALETSKTSQDLVINKLKKKVKRLEKKQRARTPGMKLFKIGTSRRKSLDKENVSKQGRNLKTRSMFKEGDFDDDFYDTDDMVNEEIENVEGDTVNAGGAINTTSTGVSVASASVTTAGVSISTAKPRTPPTTTTTAFEDEDLTIA
ncbi:hypothetical protein Tco_0382888 [Tanacetum coccineum]